MLRDPLETGLGAAERSIYVVAAAMLVAAGGATAVGSVTEITAEVEGHSGRDVIDFVIQIGALAVLALVLTISITLLRRSGSASPAARLPSEVVR
jgi:hypothetical protein